MYTKTRTATIVGSLFIIGTLSGISSVLLTGPIWSNPDYLVHIAANENKIITGAIFVLIMGFSLAMIPLMMFPVFRKYNEVLALGSVVFRGVLETVTYIAIVISWLLLLALSQEYVKAGTPDASYFHVMGTVLLRAVDTTGLMVSITFSLGALMIYYLFYQSKLIPRWLSVWGFAGAVLYLTVPLFGMFGPEPEILYAPLAVQEMVLAVWLIAKGFKTPAILSESSNP